MNGNICALISFFFLGSTALAQGFAGLGTEAKDFAVPVPWKTLIFPDDHGPHPAYRIEWWYLTATLESENGTQYGVQWTLFRSALHPGDGTGWQTPLLWMGHAALTTQTDHFTDERRARGGIGQAGVAADPFIAWVDDWQMAGQPDKGLSELSLTARGPNFHYDLNMKSTGPLVLHGDKGFSVKSPEGQASYYYSQPAYDVTGTLNLPTGPVKVSGQGWLDREWSSQPLSGDQTGWDWFSLSFDSGARMMGFRLRDSGAGYTSATWIYPDGRSLSLPDGSLHLTPVEQTLVSGKRIPTRWQVELPDQGLNVEVVALNPQSWMDTSFPYWEGPVSVNGTHTGRGYLEMTGYD